MGKQASSIKAVGLLRLKTHGSPVSQALPGNFPRTKDQNHLHILQKGDASWG
jgi:hypothetical protein